MRHFVRLLAAMGTALATFGSGQAVAQDFPKLQNTEAVSRFTIDPASKGSYLENKGQWDSQALFMTQSPGLRFWGTKTGFVLDSFVYQHTGVSNLMKGHAVALDLVGASGKGVSTVYSDLDPCHVDWIKSMDPKRKEAYIGLKVAGEVQTKNLIPGVDMRSYYQGGMPRYDIIVQPGVDANSLTFEVKGANSVIAEDRNLIVHTSLGNVTLGGLHTYQMIRGKSITVDSSFQVKGNKVTLDLANYDRTKAIIIDPVVYGSYIGGRSHFSDSPFLPGADGVTGTASDGNGNVYMAGTTISADFPINFGPYVVNISDSADGFVAALQGDAYTATYVAYIGGLGKDSVNGIEVDQYGNVWIAGITQSWILPRTKTETRIRKISGDIIGGTFAMSYQDETGTQVTDPLAFDIDAAALEVALNGLSNAPPGGFTVTGGPLPNVPVVITNSDPNGRNVRLIQATQPYDVGPSGIPLPAFPQLQQVFHDAAAFGFTPTGGTFQLGFGTSTALTAPIAFDADGATVSDAINLAGIVAGNPSLGAGGPLPGIPCEILFTNNPNNVLFADSSGLTSGLLGEEEPPATFVMRWKKSITTVLDPVTSPSFIRIEQAGDIRGFDIKPVSTPIGPVDFVIVGRDGTPTEIPGTAPTKKHGHLLVFRAVDASGAINVVSSRSGWIGGQLIAYPNSVVMDSEGSSYVVGTVSSFSNKTLGPNSFDFYTTNGTFANGSLLRRSDAFIRKYTSSGAISYSAVIGGSGHDDGLRVAVDPLGNAYVLGVARSSNFPRTVGAYDQNFGTGAKNFITKINNNATQIVYSTGLNSNVLAVQRGFVVDARGNAYVAGMAIRPLIGVPIPITPSAPAVANQIAALDPAYGNGTVAEGYLTVLNATATGLLYSSLNGEGAPIGTGYTSWNEHIHVDKTGSIWLSGGTGALGGEIKFGIEDNPAVMPLMTDFNLYDLVGAANAGFIHASYISAIPFQQSQGGGDGFISKLRIALPILSTITVNPTEIPGGFGASSNVTVTLRDPAPVGGSQVTVRISNPSIARFTSETGPTNLRVTIPAGSNTTGPIPVFSRQVVTTSSTDIRAELDGDFLQTRLNVRPWFDKFILASDEVFSGQTVRATVTLFQPAILGTLVANMTSDSPLITFPGGTAVSIPIGQQSISFDVQAGLVSVPTLVNVTATVAGVAITQSLTIQPARVDSLEISPDTVNGGEPTSMTVFLQGAGGGGQVIALSQTGPIVGVPTTVNVPLGATSVVVPITTSFVPADATTNITASLNGGNATDQLFLKHTNIASITLSVASVLGGGVVTGTINLTVPAGPTGLNVPLSNNNPTAGTVAPASVFIAAGATTATFTITTKAVPVTQNLVVTANKPGYNAAFATLQVRAFTFTFTFTPTTLLGGITNTTGKITLLGGEIAPAGGLTILLDSTSATALTIPASVSIPAGTNTVSFTGFSNIVNDDTTVHVTASGSGISVVASVLIKAPKLATLTVAPTTVTGGNNATGTVSLDHPAPTGGFVVNLSSNNANIIVPATVFVPAGATTASFAITTVAVAVNQSGIITAVLNGVSKTATLTLAPAAIVSFTVSPTSVRGGLISTATINLESAAPIGGLVITITSNKPTFVSHAATVNVPAGATTVSFPINTSIVTIPVGVTFSATVPGRTAVTTILTITGTP